MKAPSASRVPARLRQEIQTVLITQTRLARRVRMLAQEIERDFAGLRALQYFVHE